MFPTRGKLDVLGGSVMYGLCVHDNQPRFRSFLTEIEKLICSDIARHPGT